MDDPHIWFYVDVKDEKERSPHGVLQCSSGYAFRRVLTKDALKIGSVVNVEVPRARKNGSTMRPGRKVTFADGRNVLTASAEDVGR